MEEVSQWSNEWIATNRSRCSPEDVKGFSNGIIAERL
jgi:hypothetical protein